MNDVFISYSRKDKEFVRQLHTALQTHQQETWVDWQDIPLTADWWEEIERGIEGANTFVFIISPDSIISKVCRQEIEHAVEHNKRLIPIVHRDDFDIEQAHPALKKHNWLLFREQDDFDLAFAALIDVIKTDLEHTSTHYNVGANGIKARNAQFIEQQVQTNPKVRELNLSHPYYWAGFTMIGNPW